MGYVPGLGCPDGASAARILCTHCSGPRSPFLLLTSKNQEPSSWPSYQQARVACCSSPPP